jgi:hypothetical protein
VVNDDVCAVKASEAITFVVSDMLVAETEAHEA